VDVTPAAVDISGVCFGYPGQQQLLDGITLSVSQGESVCLLGPNGSGKTTLLRCVLALEKVHAGSVRINGHNAHTLSRRLLAREVAYVPQATSVVFPFSVLDIVLMARTSYLDHLAVPSKADAEAAMRSLEQVGIAHLSDRPLQQISGGERQLALIARALCQNARVVVMDEPTASLDYGNQIRVLKIVAELQQAGYAVIMSAHNPDHAFMVATHAAILKKGRLIAYGEPRDIITTESLSALYGAPIRVVDGSIVPVLS
jgi:iron complex transport system ATP-binding protein